MNDSRRHQTFQRVGGWAAAFVILGACLIASASRAEEPEALTPTPAQESSPTPEPPPPAEPSPAPETPATPQVPPAPQPPPSPPAPPVPTTSPAQPAMPLPPPPKTPSATTPTTKPATPPTPAIPAAPNIPQLADRLHIFRTAISTRWGEKSRVGLSAAAEMRSPLPYDLLGGPGIELSLFESQDDSDFFSFLPVYWAAESRPLKRFPDIFFGARLGFDIHGQSGDDTLASRNYYALSVGRVTRLDQANALHWELIYSRMRGAYPGVAFSVGYRY